LSAATDAPAPITDLKGVGPRLAEKLERIGVHTVADLLFHLPLRYQDRTRVVPIGSLRPGQEAVVVGTVDYAEVVLRRKRMLLAHLSDGTGAILLRFFHFSRAQQEGLARGARILCFGEARAGTKGLEMVHPEYRRLLPDEDPEADEALTPIYPTTEGLHQIGLRKLSDQALEVVDALPDLLPEALVDQAGLPTLHEALRYVHRPPPDANVAQLMDGKHPAQQRLAFEELVAHNLSLIRMRDRADRQAAPVIDDGETLVDRFQDALPFDLTGAQQRVIDEIRRDLAAGHPMLRLVQGDVGSGKTVVAASACLFAVASGYQAAVMAPTEILAEQHYASFRQWLEPLGIEVAWLSGKQKAAARREMQAKVESGAAKVVVGTHALFQGEVAFDDLGLVVIDEQHRFGVHQRMALREKGAGAGGYPHQLIMTATPIPRTLAMTAYADLDYSVIDELPPGRTPIKTVAVADSRRDEVVARVAGACAQGRQAYWVCTLIEESEALQCQAAEDTYVLLADALPQLAVGLVHGRMKPSEKEGVMQRFKAGEIDLLIATTVIEVGVDVPNASLMVIENAERLGLAQLHQLRGRVGRGTAESSCVLMYHAPLSQTARKRLNAMRETTDGFEIARIDLELRGPGEVLGTRQTGMMQFRIADVLRDQPLLPEVQRTAQRVLREHPDQVGPLIRRWVGDALQYGRV
jgi:ATP-dependent DNA helicase RecG